MKCLVLAAGYATRLYPLTQKFPKPLLEVKGKTIIDHLLDDLDRYNKINEYIIVSNHKYIDHFTNWQKSKKLKSPITIIDDMTESNEERLGAVVDIDLVIKKLNINEDLMVIAGDNLLDFSLITFINYFEKKMKTCIMRYYEEDINKLKRSANVIVNQDDYVKEMIEKPDEPKSHWCAPAFYLYAKEDLPMVDEALKEGSPKDAPGSFIAYLYQKRDVYAMEMPGKRYDIGTLETLEEVRKTYKGIIKQ